MHLASSRESSSIIKNHTLSSFPSTDVLKLLLECGADPNALDLERNSPLHLAAANRQASLASFSSPISPPPLPTADQNSSTSSPSSPTANSLLSSTATATATATTTGQTTLYVYSERDKLIHLLLNSGSHLDSINVHGKTAADLYKNGKMYQIINPINYLTLQCLAAKVIKKYDIAYENQLTTKLSNFVAIH
jgi:ankyrin repeat protein